MREGVKPAEISDFDLVQKFGGGSSEEACCRAHSGRDEARETRSIVPVRALNFLLVHEMLVLPH